MKSKMRIYIGEGERWPLDGIGRSYRDTKDRVPQARPLQGERKPRRLSVRCRFVNSTTVWYQTASHICVRKLLEGEKQGRSRQRSIDMCMTENETTGFDRNSERLSFLFPQIHPFLQTLSLHRVISMMANVLIDNNDTLDGRAIYFPCVWCELFECSTFTQRRSTWNARRALAIQKVFSS